MIPNKWIKDYIINLHVGLDSRSYYSTDTSTYIWKEAFLDSAYSGWYKYKECKDIVLYHKHKPTDVYVDDYRNRDWKKLP